MNTTIRDQLKLLYDYVGTNMDEDIDWYRNNGIVVEGPDYLIAGRDVDGRGWYIHVAVGDIGNFVRNMPYYLPYVGWRRLKHGGEVRWYPVEQLVRRL